jgi:succinate dehydrogenase/fumarate reductase-like Fe-S protein
MSYNATMRVWRGDDTSGALQDYTVEVNEGEVVLDQAQEQHGLGYCNITKCCTEVCPESIKITDNALIPMKERVADRKYDPVVWLGNKLFRR